MAVAGGLTVYWQVDGGCGECWPEQERACSIHIYICFVYIFVGTLDSVGLMKFNNLSCCLNIRIWHYEKKYTLDKIIQ